MNHGMKYQSLLRIIISKFIIITDLNSPYWQGKFLNLFISCAGIFGQFCDSTLEMCKYLDIDQRHLNSTMTKIFSIIIHNAYSIIFSEIYHVQTHNSFLIDKYSLHISFAYLMLLVAVSQSNTSYLFSEIGMCIIYDIQ